MFGSLQNSTMEMHKLLWLGKATRFTFPDLPACAMLHGRGPRWTQLQVPMLGENHSFQDEANRARMAWILVATTF